MEKDATAIAWPLYILVHTPYVFQINLKINKNHLISSCFNVYSLRL